MTATQSEYTKVTIRKTGKAHRAFVVAGERGKYLVCSCTCPGSSNGRLTAGARIVAQGWEASNCGN